MAGRIWRQGAAKKYRRTKRWGYAKWHYNPRCRLWPRHDFDEVRYEPANERDLCEECKRMTTRWF